MMLGGVGGLEGWDWGREVCNSLWPVTYVEHSLGW